MTIILTEGWTQELGPFTLRINEQPVNLQGMTVALRLKRNGVNVAEDTTGDVRVASDQLGAERGQVYYTPDPLDLSAAYSPYTMRWEVTDGSGRKVFFPSGQPDTLKVMPL